MRGESTSLICLQNKISCFFMFLFFKLFPLIVHNRAKIFMLSTVSFSRPLNICVCVSLKVLGVCANSFIGSKRRLKMSWKVTTKMCRVVYFLLSRHHFSDAVARRNPISRRRRRGRCDPAVGGLNPFNRRSFFACRPFQVNYFRMHSLVGVDDGGLFGGRCCRRNGSRGGI